MILPPGSKLGVLGGGQLGKMFAVAAARLGYKVVVYTPDSGSPASQVAAETIVADFSDEAALAKFVESVSAVTIEFENIPVDTIRYLERRTRVFPGSSALEVAQDRGVEKSTLASFGLPVTPFKAISSQSDIRDAFEEGSFSTAILKTARLGYDGKGQRTVTGLEEGEHAFIELGEVPCVLEKRIALQREVSVVVARNESDDVVIMGPFENAHSNGILDLTSYPASISDNLRSQVTEISKSVAQKLNYEGVLCVEFFISDSGEVLINEIAPRPHNSGHLTIEGFHSSQFEQQVRVMAGLPLGSGESSVQAAVMANLLGEVWNNGKLKLEVLEQYPNVALHLYGKEDPRAGRKMGHLTVVGDDLAVLSEKLVELRVKLAG